MAENDKGNWTRFASFGFEVAAGMGLGYVVGSFIDRHAGTSPWGLVVCLLVGCAAGMYLMIKDVIRMNKD
jgi:ATP synthase protein I